MKKITLSLLLLFTCFLFTNCEKEELTADRLDISSEVKTNGGELEKKNVKKKVLICHKTNAESNPWKIISVSSNAVEAHLNHGDAVDMDGDGFFNMENGCSPEIDFDDDNPESGCYLIWYVDGDEDGFGAPDTGQIYPCGVEPCPCCVWALNDDDCDDFDLNVPANIACPGSFNPKSESNQKRDEPINCDDFPGLVESEGFLVG